VTQCDGGQSAADASALKENQNHFTKTMHCQLNGRLHTDKTNQLLPSNTRGTNYTLSYTAILKLAKMHCITPSCWFKTKY